MKYYRRDGTLYADVMEWARDFEETDRRVARTVLLDGKIISTVWMGLDHGFGTSRPLIFETMVFSSDKESGQLDLARYSTEEEAIAGHEVMVTKWSKL